MVIKTAGTLAQIEAVAPNWPSSSHCISALLAAPDKAGKNIDFIKSLRLE